MDEYIQEILAIVRSNLSVKEKKEKLLQYHDSDIADAFEQLSDEEKLQITKVLGADEVSDVLTYVDDKEDVLDYVKNDDVAADIIQEMDADDAVDVLQEMEEDDRNKIISLIDDKEHQQDIKLILSFPEDEVGSLMTTNFVTIKEHDDVKTAMKSLIDQASENDNISTLFVIDDNNKYVGALDLKDLIIARAGSNLEEKILKNYPSLHAHDKIDDVINDVKDYAEDIIPVLDEKDQISGVITSNDIVELVQSEATEDYQKLAGLTEQETVDESLFQSIKKRIPWLILLLFLGLVVSTVISAFENVIASVTAAVIFQSVVFDMSGNGGTQSLAVTLTSINNEDELGWKKIRKMIFKEVRVGFMNGVILGSISFAVILTFLVVRNQPVRSGQLVFDMTEALKVAASVGIALLIALSISSLLGLLLPVFFKKIKIDPAVASGPMITTVNDICSACIYYVLIGLFFQIF